MIRPPPRSPLFPYTTLSDLNSAELRLERLAPCCRQCVERLGPSRASCDLDPCSGTTRADRKSTRLNSSHTVTSYAVFCLKKKNSQWSHRSRESTHREYLNTN